MTILVTGGAGYIGSHMVHALRDAGERTVVLDNLSTGLAQAVPEGVPLVVGDCGDMDMLGRLFGEHRVEAILHFAGSVVVSESVADPMRYYENNFIASLSLVEAATRAGISQVVFSSTAAVYGNPDHVPVGEDAPLAPVSPYGRSKQMVEQMLADVAASSPFSYVVLRYFNVAGADPQMRTGQSSKDATHLIKLAVRAALGLRPGLEIYGTDYLTPDGTCIRDYIHVADLVQAHLDALRHLRQGGAPVTLNCGYGHGASVREVIEAVKRRSGRDFPVREAARRPGDPVRLVAACERIRSVLGFKPKFDNLDLIVDHALAWERTMLERSGVR
jgi:UDP-glucose 4-epimerase